MTQQALINGPGELIAAIPHMLGFAPTESVVVVAVLPGGELGTVLRVDRADCLDAAMAEPLGRSVARHLERCGASLAVVVSMTTADVGVGCPAIEALRPAIARAVPDVEEWACTGTRYFAPGCARPSCCPPGGRPLPDAARLAGLAAVVRSAGHGAARRDPASAHPVTESQRRKAARAGERWWAHRSDLASWRHRSLEQWNSALDLARAGELPAEADAGRIIAALGDRVVRDAALVSLVPGQGESARRIAAEGATADVGAALDVLLNVRAGRAPDPATVEALSTLATWLTSLARNGRRAPLLTLCALMAWWEGDARESAGLLEAALALDPGYRLAQLLECTLLAGIEPGWLRAA